VNLITRDSDYAVQAVCLIAEKKEKRVSVRELVRELKIPRHFLRRILQVLSRKGILKSYEGRRGGFSLSLKPSFLSLLDIITVFQGDIRLNGHTFKKKICPHIRNCRIKKELDLIERDMIAGLESITIRSIIK